MITLNLNQAYLHVVTAASGAEIINTSDFRCKTNAACAMNATRHNGFHQWTDVFVLNSPAKIEKNACKL